MREIMAAHKGQHMCLDYMDGAPVVRWYIAPLHGEECLPFRLAEALAASEAKVARVRAWRDRETRGGWIERPVEELDAALSDDPEAFLDALADQPEVSP